MTTPRPHMPLSVKRKRRSRRERVALFEAHDGTCHICGGKIQPGQAWDWSHVIALAAGGDDTVENSAPAHAKCHRGKGSQTATEDMPRIAKTKRQHARHIGAEPPKQKIRSPGFRKRRKRGRIELPNELPPAPLMRR